MNVLLADKLNPGMQLLDWGIVGGLILLMLLILFFCQTFLKNSADFLAASRCAGRYVLCISQGIAGFAVVNSVATFEMFYQAGFSSTWWAMLSSPISLILSLVAWVSYRMRETRCFTLSQFFEVRYSRKFRVASGIITWISGVVNYGIFPAVSVRFFMFFCRMPEHYQFIGVNWDVYAVLLTIAIALGVLFAVCGGQIAIMVTDFIQGTLCNISFIVFILFIFKLGDWDVSGGYVSWKQISDSLVTDPGLSQINPFECTKVADFNIWYYLIGLLSVFYSRGAWQGSMGYAAAAKTPHEGKMAGILGTWRGMAQGLMIMLFPLAVIVIMRHPDFADLATSIKEVLSHTSNPQLQKQGLVPTALSLIMPTGLLGLFVAVMFAAMLSTDDTYMHSWGSIFVQDVIMPFKKKPFTPKQHIWVLRFSVIFVGVFAWLFSYYFRQTDYVFMFFAITGAIVSGAGAAIIGGLYWKRGGTIAAWLSYIVGAFIAVSGIVLQQVWRFQDGSGLAQYLKDSYHWEWVVNNMEKFPVNGQWVSFIGMVSCIAVYVLVSLFEHYILKRPDFNLMKMLHRGEYDTKQEHVAQSQVGWLARVLGITPEFNFMDKFLYGITILWTLGWFAVFVWFTSQYFCFGSFTATGEWIPGVSNKMWFNLWHAKIYITLILALITTVWFFIGGIVDVTRLFKNLKQLKRNDSDDGSVIDGQNAGE